MFFVNITLDSGLQRGSGTNHKPQLTLAISSSVLSALTHIINTSLHTGTFPTAFKQARVTPLLRKPSLNPALLENYRPSALLSVTEALRLTRAALDTVNHQILLSTLMEMGVSGTALQWFKSHLSGSVIQKHGFSHHCYSDDTQLYFSFQPDDPTVPVRITACLTDISGCMKDHHLQLNLAKTELLVISAIPALHHNCSIQIGSSTIAPSRTARNHGDVML
ncbi:LINE-1 retrotransposable element ORF2 protein [Labeo rohita]|uniref:LINE-1 retrotransposable element ORF2 protein n=1 Tax=Labeo rohita TaxID=84645 RepID=A0ABQ8LC60_LABRO|nr:LINE-1 retrotransposable element ORF2 protein [Labeo rohita]